jgi:hypothetical protein
MLFKNYQNQIHKFLNSTYNLLTKREAIFTTSENIKSIEVPVIDGIDILNELSSEIDFKDKKSLLKLIAYYNPSSTNNLILSNTSVESEDTLLKLITRLFIELKVPVEAAILSKEDLKSQVAKPQILL